jgi:hypothetical protein
MLTILETAYLLKYIITNPAIGHGYDGQRYPALESAQHLDEATII